MSVAAVYCLHYGVEWLRWSIRSVRDLVDDVFVFYSSEPSHGQTTDMECPETREQLLDSALRYGVKWYNVGGFQWEGQHRDFMLDTVKRLGYNQALVVDADEIWDASHLAEFLQLSLLCRVKHIRNVRVALNHFWRGVGWYCKDDASPLRLFNLEYSSGEEYYPLDRQRVFHMGYAQSSKLIAYKMSIHGHKNELRPRWFEDVFLPWKPGMGNVHPTGDGSSWKEVLEYVDDGTLKALIGDHPYWLKGIIE